MPPTPDPSSHRPHRERPLAGKVAIVAGATRGAGRAIAIELGAAGTTVYVTGRSTRSERSPMDRPETIEETAELVEAAGGSAIAVRVDHSDPEQVGALIERVSREQGGRLDVLVNDVWGGDPLIRWETPFWEHPLTDGLAAMRQAVDTHLITSWHAVPPMLARGEGLIVEVNDGIGDEGYRENLYYDLSKYGVLRLAHAEAEELAGRGITVVCVSPGFLRSEAVLDHFGVTEDNWRDAGSQDPHFLRSETPHYLGRGVAALAGDPDVARHHGAALSSAILAREYDVTDVDGTQPDFLTYLSEYMARQA